MQPEHGPYCDRRHPPRQRCNAALAAQPAQPPAAGAPWLDEGTPPAAPDAQREAIAAAEMPSPTPYAAREWEGTAVAVEAASDPAPGERPTGAEREARWRPPLAAVLVAAAIAIALLVWLMRPRAAEAPGEA